jgi:hypothetical protein
MDTVNTNCAMVDAKNTTSSYANKGHALLQTIAKKLINMHTVHSSFILYLYITMGHTEE